jgi:hypothetical protein
MVKRITWFKKAVLGLAIATILGVAAFILVYQIMGRTPRELFDYVEERLRGHPKLQAVALPFIWEVRAQLNEPSLKERQTLQFNIPPPPPLIVDTAGSTVSTLAPFGQRIIRVGPNGDALTIADAAKLARDGDIVEILAGNYYGDVATWTQKKLTIRGVGGHARLYASGKSAGGKAIWVIRNGDFTIDNIDFIGAKVGDQNGAGIRFENGNLLVRHCLFYGNESGIMTGNKRSISVTVENSEFAYNGTRSGKSHAIYAGGIDTLNMTGNYLHHSNTGHLIKSRARNSNVLYNRITDEFGRASYEVNLPNGGNTLIMGNIIQQSRETENSTIIRYGEEGYTEPNNTLRLINNTIVNSHPFGGAFLRAAPGTQTVISVNNLYIGQGKLHPESNLEASNDIYADWDIFELPQRFNYTLNAKGLKVARINAPDAMRNLRLPMPDQQYTHPVSTILLAQKVTHSGALQPSSSVLNSQYPVNVTKIKGSLP